MNKKLFAIVVTMISLLFVGSAMASGGWKLLTAQSKFNVVEGVVMQYYEVADGNWHDLPNSGGSVEFGEAQIMPGETNTFYLRAKNSASSGTLGLIVEIDPATYLTHDVVCKGADSTGTEYSFGSNTVYVKLPSDGVWKTLGFETVADGDTPIGYILFNNTVTRTNPQSTYEVVCP